MVTIQRSREFKIFKIFSLIYLLFILSGSLCIVYFRANFIINISNSIPIGIYQKKITIPQKYEKGMTILTNIPENARNYIKDRKYLPKNIKTLAKVIYGTEGDKIEIINSKLYINSVFYKNVYINDSLGRKLPIFTNKILKENEFFLLGNHENSFDSRYFGVVTKKDILCSLKLIYKF